MGRGASRVLAASSEHGSGGLAGVGILTFNLKYKVGTTGRRDLTWAVANKRKQSNAQQARALAGKCSS